MFLDSRGQAYYCRQGYLRTSSYKFELDPEDPDNRFVHLTNNAVQKFSKSFGSHEDGNIMSFEQFAKIMDEEQPAKKFTLDDLWEKMK